MKEVVLNDGTRDVSRHHQAVEHMSREVEGLMRTGLPHYTWAINHATFRLSHIFEATAPRLALEITRFNAIER
jgi:hypothetical protein